MSAGDNLFNAHILRFEDFYKCLFIFIGFFKFKEIISHELFDILENGRAFLLKNIFYNFSDFNNLWMCTTAQAKPKKVPPFTEIGGHYQLRITSYNVCYTKLLRHPPYAVINDLDLLSFLPVEMLLEGVAEALKVALIKDRDFFHDILVNAELIAEGDLHIIEKIIVRSANIHSEHIAAGGDPFELGGARPLDFGHWAAHKLELLTSHRLRHGAAVAIGIMLDSLYAKRNNFV